MALGGVDLQVAVLLPLFFISGALFPLSSPPTWLRDVAYADPVAYGVDLLRGAALGSYRYPAWLSLAVLAASLALLTWTSIQVFQRGEDA